jgi:hypothetical protein
MLLRRCSDITAESNERRAVVPLTFLVSRAAADHFAHLVLTLLALFIFNFPIETACAKENLNFKIILVEKPPAHPPNLNDLYNNVEVVFLYLIHSLRSDTITAFETYYLRRTFVHNEELHNSSPNIIRMITSRRMRWAGHVA